MARILILLASYACCSLAAVSLTLVHLGDIRGKFTESSPQGTSCHHMMKKMNACSGGMARAATVIKELREKAKAGKIPPVILVSNGNIMTGGVLALKYTYNISSDLMNLLQPECVSLGVHEFDRGLHGMKEYVRRLKAPVVLTNVDPSTVPSGVSVARSHVIKLNNFSLGVVAYISLQLSDLSAPGNMRVLDEVTSLTKECNKLAKNGIQAIIALGCSGWTTDQRVASVVPHVDIIVGGLSTLLFYQGTPPSNHVPFRNYPFIVVQSSGRKVGIVYAYAFTKYLGFINLTFTNTGRLVLYNGNPIYLGSAVPEDSEATALLNKYMSLADLHGDDLVGNTSVILEGSEEKCALGECNLGNLVTDAMVTYASTKFPSVWTHVPIDWDRVKEIDERRFARQEARSTLDHN